MSEITKRLLTDDTGQEIVGALEDLALAVKPTGAEIDMSSTDTTKVKDAIETNSEAIANVQNGFAYIVGNTNTTGSTLAVGQFVYVKGHSTIAEGLRKVTNSISAGGNITTSNTSACSDGGLNALNDQIAIQSVTFTPVTGVTVSAVNIYRIGDLMIGSMYLKITDATLLAVNKTLGTYSVTLANTDKLQGIGQGNKIGYFMNAGNNLTVDNNYALPDIGNYVWVVEVHGKVYGG